ncbi:hypothetical protein [Dyella japonica]|uniref:hypothetical protein n=1 Tax=Dyella japonica TaxID=231455 RepID=UPI0012E04BB9|nr:hypothetical protein [Dyella japonica]
MNSDELMSILEKLHIPRIAYGIRELSAWDGFCILEAEGQWSLAYSSRGKVTASIHCESESQACKLLLEKLKGEFFKDGGILNTPEQMERT